MGPSSRQPAAISGPDICVLAPKGGVDCGAPHEARLRKQEALLGEAQALSHVGTWEWDLETGELTWSDELCRIFGVDPDTFVPTYAAYAAMVHPEDLDRTLLTVAEARASGTLVEREYRIVRPDGSIRYVQGRGKGMFDQSGALARMVGTAQDVTAHKRAELELQRTAAILEQRTRDLERSNAELEQFAYVASHDLQEPLRMVASYTELLRRRYAGRLDDDADAFIGYAVDGALRMQALINDLLAYSRIGTRGQEAEKVDCAAVLDRVLDDLRVAIEQNHATVEYDSLPVVMADPVQVGELFQNLLGNALKFRGEAAPRIRISATRVGGFWRLDVCDNGIGIPPEHASRVFAVFQRLHTQAEYPGTGVGLAICKRIVERHGGRIWLEPTPGGGATFCFTLPASAKDGA